MKQLRLFAGILVVVGILASAGLAKGPRYTDPEKADADFPLQGEYTGEVGDEKIGVQIIALGDGAFRSVVHKGGLPGDGWDKSDKMVVDGKRDGDTVVFECPHGTATLTDGKLAVKAKEGDKAGVLKKTVRKSPTLGAKPPEGAVVLFDGKNADAFEGGRLSEDGLLMQGVTSKQKFGSHKLHIEFRLPYQPKDRGQGRGNSGIYVQGRYEIQMLDSFGLEGKQNECGGIYSVGEPAVNMCFPPLSWQTYDIEFTATKYEDGKAVAPPRMTVYHNGVKIHDDIELPADRSTTAAPAKPGPEPGPVFLQNHGCPVRYRNIWVVEAK